MPRTERYIARVNPKTGDFEVYDTKDKDRLDPRACAERMNELFEMFDDQVKLNKAIADDLFALREKEGIRHSSQT